MSSEQGTADNRIQTAPEQAPAEIIHTPYYVATRNAFLEQYPGNERAITTALDNFDEQAIGNFAVYKSPIEQDIAFTYSRLTITPDMINQFSVSPDKIQTTQLDEIPSEIIASENSEDEQEIIPKKEIYFLFSAFGPPPGGHAFTVQDVAIDRFIRTLPHVAHAMKTGKPVPEIEMYLLGSPPGFGGHVTPELIQAIKQEGMEPYARLYSEFIMRHIPADDALDQCKILLQGVSKGSIVAERTSRLLPSHVQQITQRLLDNPAGYHNASEPGEWVKGAQVAIGFGAETIFRVLFDNTMMKPLLKLDNQFLERLSQLKQIPFDDKQQLRQKRQAALAEAIALIKGSPLDTIQSRSFIRQAIFDPLSMSIETLSRVQEKTQNAQETNFQALGRDDGEKPEHRSTKYFPTTVGNAVVSPIGGAHMFIYNRYHRWNTILNYCENLAA